MATKKAKTTYPSVTQILRPFIPVEYMTDDGRNRGTRVHNYCRAYLEGRYVVPEVDDRGYFESFKKFADRFIDGYIYLEKRYVDDKYCFHGKADGLFNMKGYPGTCIGDWKTGVMQKTYVGQVAAYWHLARINGHLDCNNAFVLSLRQNGAIAVPKFIPNLELEFNYFLNAFAAFNRYGR
uniref:PD-(D/E)XK endonuclease-like domain-containing protein n=1 Tax=viral metagenome TaxID=1070528 RepID=A0A6M3XW28_9ZZZZ